MNAAKAKRAMRGLSAKGLLKHKIGLGIIGAALGVVVTAHMVFVGPLGHETSQLRLQLTRQEELIGKYRDKIGQASELSEDIANLRRRSGLAALIDAGANPAKAAAAMDAVFSGLEAQGMKKVSFQPLETSKNGDFIEANMKCAMSGDVRGLHALFKALDDYPEPVKVKEIVIRVLSEKRPRQLDPMTVVITVATIIGIDKEG